MLFTTARVLRAIRIAARTDFHLTGELERAVARVGRAAVLSLGKVRAPRHEFSLMTSSFVWDFHLTGELERAVARVGRAAVLSLGKVRAPRRHVFNDDVIGYAILRARASWRRLFRFED